MRKWVIVTGLVLSCGGLAAVTIVKFRAATVADKRATSGQLVQVVKIDSRAMTQKVSAPASLEASGVRELRAPFASAQVTLKVGLGDQVEQGQVIAILTADELNLQLRQQKLAVSRSEMALDSLRRQRSALPTARKQRLTSAELQLVQARQAVTAAEQSGNALLLQQARLQEESAKLALDAAKDTGDEEQLNQQIKAGEAELALAKDALTDLTAKLEQAAVKAPVAGTILAVGLKDGQPATPGMPLVELGSLDTLTVRARVDEVDVAKVKPSMPLDLTASSYVGDHFDGTVKRVSPQAAAGDPRLASVGTAPNFDVQGEVKNTDGKLRPGMNGLVTITTASRTKVMVVATAGLREDEKGTTVLVVRDHIVHVTPVKIGLLTETLAEVLSGLQEGDLVVVDPSGVRDLNDGATVDPQITPLPTAGDSP